MCRGGSWWRGGGGVQDRARERDGLKLMQSDGGGERSVPWLYWMGQRSRGPDYVRVLRGSDTDLSVGLAVSGVAELV